MTLDKLIYDVREALNDYTVDTTVSDRYILYLYQIKRSKYLRREIDDLKKPIDSSIQQTYCSSLEEVGVNTCGVNIECDTIMRTKEKVPQVISSSVRSAVTSIKPLNIVSRPFNVIGLERVPNIAHSPFKGSIYAFIGLDGYIYLYSTGDEYKNIKCISVSGVFEDPLELSNYSSECSSGNDIEAKCFDEMKSNYPLQPHNIELIRDEIIMDLSRKIQFPEDKANDNDSLDINRLTSQNRRRQREERREGDEEAQE